MKRIIAIILLAIMVCGLCGCGQKETAATSVDASTANAEPVRQEKKMLGVLLCETDADTYEDISAYCDGTALSLSDYEDYKTLCCEDWETALNVLLCGEFADCTDIIFVGSETCCALAEDLWTENPVDSQQLYTLCVKVTVTPNITASYSIEYDNLDKICRDFSEGRAWVRYSDDERNVCYGLIDTNGFLVYSLNLSKMQNEAKSFDGVWRIATTAVKDGITIVYGGNGGYDDIYSGMIVLDRFGNELFSSEDCPEGEYYYYKGYGDGKIFFFKNVSGFSKNKWYLCEMDTSGQVTYCEEYAAEYDPLKMLPFDYFGEGVYQLFVEYEPQFIRGPVIYNQITHEFFEPKYLLEGTFTNGKSVLVDDRVAGYDYIYSVTSADCLNYASMQDYIENIDSKPQLNEYFYGISEGIINSGTYYIRSDGANIDSFHYYDMELELITLPEDWHIKHLGLFSGEYAPVLLEGADGKTYTTIVDSSGTPQYDPVKVSGWDEHSWYGYVSANKDAKEAIIAPDGSLISKSDLDAISEDYHVGSLVVNGGFERNENRYIDSDGNELNTVYVVSNYNEFCEYEESVILPEKKENKQEKQYVTINNFSIEGKWKNIGSETFGQAQKGAIVVFDGNNCNFFSPKDTYAFSKDGDNYKLECTSFMSTDTLTFTVKTVDEDHIDIFYGSKMIEMERVQ